MKRLIMNSQFWAHLTKCVPEVFDWSCRKALADIILTSSLCCQSTVISHRYCYPGYIAHIYERAPPVLRRTDGHFRVMSFTRSLSLPICTPAPQFSYSRSMVGIRHCRIHQFVWHIHCQTESKLRKKSIEDKETFNILVLYSQTRNHSAYGAFSNFAVVFQ